jgi:hypothetical protein
MLTLHRRFMSTLVRAEASAVLNNHVAQQKTPFQLQAYTTDNLQDYFNKEGIIFPLDTLIAKYQEKDYEFFLGQGNFMKVADSLEKFQQCLDLSSPESKNFVVFKQKLYRTWEVRNRSTLEHSMFSGHIDDTDLPHLAESNRYHVAEMERETMLERYYNHSQLKGKMYKRKGISAERLTGILSLGLAADIYFFHGAWANYLGETLPTVFGSLAFINGLSCLGDQNAVEEIEIVQEGEHKGKARITVAHTPFVKRELIAETKHVTKGSYVEGTDETSVIVLEGLDLASGDYFTQPRGFGLFSDAYVDEVQLDWLLAQTGDSDLDLLFTDLCQQKALTFTTDHQKNLLEDSRQGETLKNL